MILEIINRQREEVIRNVTLDKIREAIKKILKPNNQADRIASSDREAYKKLFDLFKGKEIHRELEELGHVFLLKIVRKVFREKGKTLPHPSNLDWELLENLYGKAEVCGYSAEAVNEALIHNGYSANNIKTVYGRYRSTNSEYSDAPYHYWSEITVGKTNYFICATYGQFDPNFRKRILIDTVDHLGEYGLIKLDLSMKDLSRNDKGTLEILEKEGSIRSILGLHDDEIRRQFDILVTKLSAK